MTVSEVVLVSISISKVSSKDVDVVNVRLDPRSFSLVNTYLEAGYRNTEDLLFSHTVDEQPIFNDFGRVMKVYFDSSFGSFYQFVKLYQRGSDKNGPCDYLAVSDYVIDGSLIPFAKENGLLDPLMSEPNEEIWTVAR